MVTKADRIRGSIFGMAYGDALAAPTEFLKVAEILARWPPNGPNYLNDHPARVTDDTQMALAVGEALIDIFNEGIFNVAILEEKLREHFIDWHFSPENNRAPGMTCLKACEQLDKGIPWVEATVRNSKGCGANMRVTPVGLMLNVENIGLEQRAALSQFQAALTHGHATALAAADLTAFAVSYLTTNGQISHMVNDLCDYAQSQRNIYHKDWLGTLWQRAAVYSEIEYISRGWDECLLVLERLRMALIKPNRDLDPCLATGDGWVAEEALATGLLAFLLFPDDPQKALQRAAVTRGDSDSIACLTGAFAGAYCGMDAWPKDWQDRIEYNQRLAILANALIQKRELSLKDEA